MKTIGILAGMGPKSTSPFLDLVINERQKQYGAKYDEDFPHMIIYSLPTPFYVDKQINHNKMKRIITKGLQKLESTGVDFIAIPCNTVHAYYDYLKKKISIPLLNIVDETLKEINQKSKKVTLLATQSTIDSQVYQKEIKKRGHKFIYNKKWQFLINKLIKSIKNSEKKSVLNKLWKELLFELKNIDVIILGCTDLNVLNIKNKKIIDSSRCLAQSVIETYLKKNNN